MQIKLIRIYYIGTLYKVWFRQDSGLFRVRFRQDSGLFRVLFRQDSCLFRVRFRQDSGLFRVRFRQDSGLFRVRFRQDSGLFRVRFRQVSLYIRKETELFRKSPINLFNHDVYPINTRALPVIHNTITIYKLTITNSHKINNANILQQT